MRFVRPRTAYWQYVEPAREDLVLNTYFPDATNTGYYPGTLVHTQTTNITYSTPGAVINDTWFDGCRPSVTAADVTFNNCLFTGENAASALLSCTNINVARLKLYDCTFRPKFVRSGHNAVDGHDFQLYRCDISGSDDFLSIQNGTLYNNGGGSNPKIIGWSTGVKVYQSYLHGLSRWTAATGGIVHGTDTVTHNDAIQQYGGVGTDVQGSTIDANWELQFGHLYLMRSSDGYVYTRAEAQALPDAGPFVSVPIGSLPDGGPFVAPFEPNGTGLRSRGQVSKPDLAGLMINNTQGYSAQFKWRYNLCKGGEYFTNGGGNTSANAPAGMSLGDFEYNQFDHDQGAQGSGGDTTQTLNFGGTWGGRVNTVGNIYRDNGNPVTVRA